MRNKQQRSHDMESDEVTKQDIVDFFQIRMKKACEFHGNLAYGNEEALAQELGFIKFGMRKWCQLSLLQIESSARESKRRLNDPQNPA